MGKWYSSAGVIFGILLSLTGCTGTLPDGSIGVIGREPSLYPDYADIVIPPNIAPLNFAVLEKASRYFVIISAPKGKAIKIASHRNCIVIPAKLWRRLLEGNRGGPLSVVVYTFNKDSGWTRFKTISDTVAADGIDPYIVYRKINLCVKWMNMGIFQRDLENYVEAPVLTSNDIPDGCMNCHSFRRNDPRDMIVQIRSGRLGTPMLVHRSCGTNPRFAAIRIESAIGGGRGGFTAWHPTRPVVVFSANSFTMLYHTAAQEVREVFDRSATLSMYNTESGVFSSINAIAHHDRLETMPEWSPDGRYLYFCSGPCVAETLYARVQCDLLRTPYDTERGLFGNEDTVLTAAKAGGSITQPRFSPDGKFIAFTLSQRGDFPIHLAQSRLCLLSTASGSIDVTDSGAKFCDAWHSWSSNGRWLAFTSKRMDGRFARPFFRYIGPDGTVHKPFVLPQRDPACYRSTVLSYNIPELVSGPVPHIPSRFIQGEESEKSTVREEYPAVLPLSHQKDVE